MDIRFLGPATIIVGLLTASLHTEADTFLYRWKDSEGDTVMSDRPPSAGTEYESISTASSVVRRVEGEAQPVQVTPKAKEAPQETAATTPSISTDEKNSEYCDNARKNLELIDRAPRIRMDDGEGGLRYITDEERAAERQKNLDILEAHCK